MLTRSDQTVADCLEVLDEIRPIGLRHIGFKDVGVPPDVLRELVAAIRAQGATSYMEVVSTSAEACLNSARVARDIGVDRLLGGTQVDEVLADPRRQRVRRITRSPASRSVIRRSSAARPRTSRPIVDGSREGLRRRRPARVSRDRGRSARAGARGAARHAGLPARRRQRRRPQRRSARSPRRAPMRSRSARRRSTARSRRSWVRCALS